MQVLNEKSSVNQHGTYDHYKAFCGFWNIRALHFEVWSCIWAVIFLRGFDMKKSKKLFQPAFNNFIEYWVYTTKLIDIFYEKEIAYLVAKYKGGYVIEKPVKQQSMNLSTWKDNPAWKPVYGSNKIVIYG